MHVAGKLQMALTDLEAGLAARVPPGVLGSKYYRVVTYLRDQSRLHILIIWAWCLI